MNEALSPDFRCRWGLYVITDRELSGLPHEEAARQALAGGARVIQLRDKSAARADLLEVCRAVADLTHRHGAVFIVNDDPHLAMEAGADGVHLGQDDFGVAEARRLLGPKRIIGLSTHTRQHVEESRSLPIDYIGFGPVYGTTTKVSAWPVTGLDNLAWACAASRVPVVAIGGITELRLPDVIAVGCPNAAIIGDLMASGEIEEKIRRLCDLFRAGVPQPLSSRGRE